MEYFPFRATPSPRYESDKEYRTAHLEQYAKYSRDAYHRTKELITCECGAVILSVKKKKHCLTKKHIKYTSPLVS